VALREGSLVVNSSQGGGSKDTWIIDPDELDGGPTVAPLGESQDVSQSQSQSQSEGVAV
jgi:uncharacterized circularly permuted ATP-grasp superfamily protein